MKPVIPDYEWITYGERVKSGHHKSYLGFIKGEQINFLDCFD